MLDTSIHASRFCDFPLREMQFLVHAKSARQMRKEMQKRECDLKDIGWQFNGKVLVFQIIFQGLMAITLRDFCAFTLREMHFLVHATSIKQMSKEMLA